MNNYLKPQSPLKDVDGDYIYPLTTVDQVVMKDGTRLNAAIKDIIDNMNNNDNGAIIPTTTTADNGKILKVINGSPAWVDISNAEEMSF